MGLAKKLFGKKIEESADKISAVVDLKEKLSKLELEDVSFMVDLIDKSDFKGTELEQATVVYLKLKFIKTNLAINNG